MMKKIILCFLCCLPFLAGCLGETLTADTLPWVGDEPILFMDDFSGQTGGWHTQEDRLSFVGYTQEGFRLWVDLPNYQVWSVPGLNFRDVNIYSRVQKIGGENDNLFGLVCRYQGEENYYAFLISSDGYYGIFKKQAGIQSLLGMEQMGFSEIINRDDAANEILVVCQDDQLALFVNEVELFQVRDATFSYGDIGMIAGTRAEPGADVLFDYLIVMKSSRR